VPDIGIARPSVASLYLQPGFQGTDLGNATGFVVERDGKRYLITNFHVVTGRKPATNENILPAGAWPDSLRIAHNCAGQLGKWIWKSEALYDEERVPLWLEHPVHRSAVDVVGR